MKEHDDTIGESPGRGRTTAVLAGLGALALATLPALAGDPGSATSGTGGGDTAFASGGDETVGTLPIVGGDKGTLEYTRFWRSARPAFYLEGAADDLHNAILGAQGIGQVRTEVIDPVLGRLRLTFQGDVVITLDRMIFHGGTIAAGLAVPRGFGTGKMTVQSGGRAPLQAPLRPGLAPLPLLSLESSGALDLSSLQILTSGRSGVHTSHAVDATADVLVLTQSY